MKPIFRLVALWTVATLVFSVTMTGGAVAQAANQTAGNQSATPGEQIDGQTRLVSSSYDGQTETATVVLESDAHQAVTIYDAGGFTAESGGQIRTRSVALSPGEQTRVRLPVTKTDDNAVLLGIQTDNTPAYAVVVEPGGDALDALENVSPTQAWFGGSGIGLSWVVLAGLYKLRKEGDEPEVAR